MDEKQARRIAAAYDASPAVARTNAIVEPYLARGLSMEDAAKQAVADGVTNTFELATLARDLRRLRKKLGIPRAKEDA